MSPEIGFIRNLDANLFYFFNHSFAHPFLDYLLAFLTEMGSLYFTLGLGLLCLLSKKREIKLLGLLILAGGFVSYAVVSILKPLCKVSRPYQILSDVRVVIDVYGYSFPSGHACLAFSAASILALKFKHVKLFFLGASLVGFSRMYLGVHFPSDVIVGALIGLLVGFVARTIYCFIESPCSGTAIRN